MTDELHDMRNDLLPVRQRFAWIVAIWFVSTGSIVAASLAIGALLR